MPPEIAVTDWILAGASVAACVATVFLAIFAWRQRSLMGKQTEIARDQVKVQESQRNILHRQMQIQGEQSAIMKRQTEISQQQLAIIKDQEADRKNAAKRADLVISSRVENEKVIDLIIKNNGPGWANEIRLYINGYPFEDCPPEICRPLPKSVVQHEIGPGNVLDNFLKFPEAPPTNLRIDISWISENGMRNHASSVKTGMHRIGPLKFFMPNSAIKARAHRGLISIDFEFWHNYKVQNEILI
jgi:hypothetical protein